MKSVPEKHKNPFDQIPESVWASKWAVERQKTAGRYRFRASGVNPKPSGKEEKG